MQRIYHIAISFSQTLSPILFPTTHRACPHKLKRILTVQKLKFRLLRLKFELLRLPFKIFSNLCLHNLCSMFSYLIELLCFLHCTASLVFCLTAFSPVFYNSHLSFPFCFFLYSHCACRPYLPFLKCDAFRKAFA